MQDISERMKVGSIYRRMAFAPTDDLSKTNAIAISVLHIDEAQHIRSVVLDKVEPGAFFLILDIKYRDNRPDFYKIILENGTIGALDVRYSSRYVMFEKL